jgi:signal transduction histidine kinase
VSRRERLRQHRAMRVLPTAWISSANRRRVLVLGPVAIALLGAILYIAQTRRASDDRRWVDHAREVLTLTNRIRTRLLDAETNQRGYMLTRDSSFLRPMRTVKPQTLQALARLRVLAHEHAEQEPRINELGIVVDAKLAELEHTMSLAESGQRDSALRVIRGGQGKAMMDEARSILGLLDSAETQLLVQRARAEQRASGGAILLLLSGGVLALLLGMLANARMGGAIQERDAALRALTNANVQLERQIASERAARAEAESANRAKSDFLSTMSHELRTPLNAISGYVDLLQLGIRGTLNEAQLDDLHRIKRSGHHLLSLINDVLNFARLEAGRVDFNLRDVDVSDVLSDIETIVKPLIVARQLSFRMSSCEEIDGIVVHADPERLRQVLGNLLSNAIKFTSPGGHITVRCEAADNGRVDILVSDTGRGIPDDQLARIFDAFVQVDRHLTHDSQQGVGLGLAISRDLVRRMGGELSVESRLSEGSTFRVTLQAGAQKRVASPEAAGAT